MTQDQQLELALEAYLWGFTDMHGILALRFGDTPPYHATKFQRYLYHHQRDLFDYLRVIKDEREIESWIKKASLPIIKRITPNGT